MESEVWELEYKVHFLIKTEHFSCSKHDRPIQIIDRPGIQYLNPQPDLHFHSVARERRKRHPQFMLRAHWTLRGDRELPFSSLVHDVDWGMGWIWDKPPRSPENSWGTWEEPDSPRKLWCFPGQNWRALASLLTHSQLPLGRTCCRLLQWLINVPLQITSCKEMTAMSPLLVSSEISSVTPGLKLYLTLLFYRTTTFSPHQAFRSRLCFNSYKWGVVKASAKKMSHK